MDDELGRPMLTISEAAEATGKSRDTIKRRRIAGAFANAEMTEAGWAIPVTDLLAAGFTVHAPAGPDPAPQSPPAPADELMALRLQLARAEGEVARWRAVAEERERAVELAELALRALPPAPEQPEGAAPRRRWGRRR